MNMQAITGLSAADFAALTSSPPAPIDADARNVAILISCGAVKLDHAAPARDLYTGSYFKALLRWAESIENGPPVFVLSALHGLLPLDRVVEPYNVRMKAWDAPSRGDAIACDVLHRQLLDTLGFGARIFFAGGADYFQVLDHIWPFAQPVFEGLGGMGKQLQWCKRNRGTLPTWAGQ